MEGKEPLWRDIRERKRKGLRKCNIEFTKEENLSGTQNGEQEILSVAVFFFFSNSVGSPNSDVFEVRDLLLSRAVVCIPGKEGTGPRVHSFV